MEDWKLSVAELEALLIPLQTSAQLEEIRISSFRSAAEEVLVGPHLQKLIRESHGLRLLSLTGEDALRAKLAAEVALALRPRLHHELEDLQFWDLWGPNASLVTIVHIAEIITCAPKLQKLRLDHVHQDAKSREALVTALKSVPHLKEFRTNFVDRGMMDVLVEVYNGTCSNTVLLEHLSLGVVDRARAEALRSLVSGNIASLELKGRDLSQVFVDDFSSDEWRNLGKCILQAPRLRKFILNIFTSSVSSDLEVEHALVQLWD